MKITKIHLGAVGISLLIIIISLFFMGSNKFMFLLGIGIVVGVIPFIVSFVSESKIEAEKEEMFLEFARSLVESVKTGTPISRSIVNAKNKPFGVLSPHIQKLAGQISIGIPLKNALETFSKDVNNPTISRALSLIGQAEKAGGDIGEILKAVTEAVNVSDKLKKERKAATSTLVTQGYIIFFVFIIIILVMQFKILPMVDNIAGVGEIGNIEFQGQQSGNSQDVSDSFLYLLIVQGFFSGLVIGKLSDGNIKAGIKHSATLMIMSFLISTGVRFFLG